MQHILPHLTCCIIRCREPKFVQEQNLHSLFHCNFLNPIANVRLSSTAREKGHQDQELTSCRKKNNRVLR